MKEDTLTWSDFKELILESSNCSEWVYRGHSSKEWEVLSTLQRFTGKNSITIKEHHAILLSLLANEKISKHPNFTNISLPQESPFSIELLTTGPGTEQHKECEQVFNCMIELRHLGFPSPLIDWTKDPYVAAFFAASSIQNNEELAIYRLKIKTPSNKIHKTPETKLHKANYLFNDNSSRNINKSHRHHLQKSEYTVLIQHEIRDRCKPFDDTARSGPVFLLDSYNDFNQEGTEIEKYIIKDTKEKERLKLLSILYRDHKLSFENIYGHTDILENTTLKDYALQKFFL